VEENRYAFSSLPGLAEVVADRLPRGQAVGPHQQVAQVCVDVRARPHRKVHQRVILNRESGLTYRNIFMSSIFVCVCPEPVLVNL
jgi:hypothetical protein